MTLERLAQLDLSASSSFRRKRSRGLYSQSPRCGSLAFIMSLLMWGIVCQGYNAVFPSFCPELFPTRSRVSAMAIAQNVGTLITALFATVAPPGTNNIPMTIGSTTLGVTIIAALAAWSARETYRIPMIQLGEPTAVPIDKAEYDRLRGQTVAEDKLSRAFA
jgi:hypothetical protein